MRDTLDEITKRRILLVFVSNGIVKVVIAEYYIVRTQYSIGAEN